MFFNHKQNLFILIFLAPLLYYGTILLFGDLEFVGVFISLIGPIIVGSLACKWLLTTYRTITDRQRYFWLILSFGVFLYMASHILLLLTTQGEMDYHFVSFLLFVCSYLSYLIALIYKIKALHISTTSRNSYLFSIFIFMIFAIVIGIQNFVQPILDMQEFSIGFTILALMHPIIGLTILFVITYLFYLSKYSKERPLISMIIFGFSIQIIANLSYLNLTVNDAYHPGHVDALWLLAVLLIGASAKFAQTSDAINWKFINFIQSKESILPYLSTTILLALILESYHWELNALSVGFLVIFFMVIGRQLIVMKKNQKLVCEYQKLAYYDSITQLKNRTAFHKDFSQILTQAAHNNQTVALILIDLDRFKTINDTYGHFVGDLVLKKVAETLISVFKTDKSIYRMSGDEFACILPGMRKEQCIHNLESLLETFSYPFLIDSHPISISMSIGISFSPEDGMHDQTLLAHTDKAMYIAKEKGNHYYFFNAELNETINRRLILENDIHYAIEDSQFELLYQPKINMLTRQIIGIEALLRWHHPQLGVISPVEFIPIAEKTGQIVAIGKWVLNTACKQNKKWQELFPGLTVSVNVSARQFEEGNFFEIVQGVLKETGLQPNYLELEITESIMQTQQTIQELENFKAIEVKTSIDDFGTGYSSLSALKTLPVDTIKIDKSFIDHMENKTNRALVKTIIDIALNLSLDVIAEGVETEEQVLALTQLDCYFGQGYLFAKPLSVTAFEEKYHYSHV